MPFDIWKRVPWAPEDDPLMGPVARAENAQDDSDEETDVEKPYDLWKRVPWAPEDDPLMGPVVRAERAAEEHGAEETAEEGDIGAEFSDPLQQQFNAHSNYIQEMLEGLEIALGTTKLSRDDVEVDECEQTLNEDIAKGYEMTLEELMADTLSLNKEIMADLDYNTKEVGAVAGDCPVVVAGVPPPTALPWPGSGD
ncbi:hypothetical protein COCOBI_13-2170 [Coccomyxa sp. Obi]|nr:hypothetical protein COCOBI_13-2170 [Coccomyxa sp. Obi]